MDERNSQPIEKNDGGRDDLSKNKSASKSLIAICTLSVLVVALIIALIVFLSGRSNDKEGSSGKNEGGNAQPTISVNSDGYVVVDGIATDILTKGEDVISIDSDGYIVVNGIKTDYLVREDIVDENPLGLLFVLKDDDTYAVEIGSAKYESKIEIPATYQGKAVTEVRNFGYDYNTSLREITIPEGVRKINDNAFYGCVNLTKVLLPDSVTDIGERAFEECLNLMSITLGKGLTNVDEYAFGGCYRLMELINHSSLKIVHEGSGYDDYDALIYDVTNVHTGESKISYIGDFVFYSDEGVHSLVSYVGEDTELTLPDSYNGKRYDIYDYFGMGIKGITSLTIPDSVTKIGYSAFGDWDLVSVDIGNGVEQIGGYAFSSCNDLISLTLGESLKTVDNSFSGCLILELVNNSDIDIAVDSADFGHPKTVHAGESAIAIIGDYWFYSYDDANYLIKYLGKDAEVVLPSSYNGENYEIYDRAFAESLIEKITIPDFVTYIGDSAFRDCDLLESIVIPDGVTEVGAYAFNHCDNLKSITIGKGFKTVGKHAFEFCDMLERIYFNAAQMTDLERYHYLFAYAGRDGRGIKLIIGKNVLRVPSCLLFAHEHYTYEFPKITSIEFESESNCESIGYRAFYGCTELTSITIPENVSNIEPNAFEYCYSLSEIKVDENNVNYKSEDNVLYSKDGTTLILYAPGNKNTEFAVPDGVTQIADSAFVRSANLTTVNIGKNVTSIGENAFNDCSKLSSVIIGDSVTSIGEYAFGSCYGLDNVYYTGSMQAWRGISMGNGNYYLQNATLHYDYSFET